MQFKTYYLAFNSPLHLGNHRPDTYETSEEYIHSDTLTAAIYAAWAKMGRSDLIPEDGVPPFVLSSAYPYVKQGDKKFHFFPRPMLRLNYHKDLGDLRKAVKKVRWLDQNYFEQVINHDHLDETLSLSTLRGDYLSADVDPEGANHISKSISQRVSIGRDVDEYRDSDPFYMERIYFRDAGLYFMIEGDTPETQEALEFLQYEGLGTDRTVGNGFFDLEHGEINLRVPQNTTLSTNMSLYTPESAKTFSNVTDHEDVAYDTLKRGGWITTQGYIGKEKKSVRMFAEGSIWCHTAKISGRANINLQPATLPDMHPIWRSGRSIFIPIKSVS
jgi:CRISPR-associated protein Csm4